MKYLFFDTECCDGVHLCEFGYVVTDESFNVTEKDVFLIAPEKPFTLSHPAVRNELKLYFSESRYASSPAFPARYSRIKKLLTDDGCLIIGHSAANDANFIRTACERYGLVNIDFTFADTQKLYAEISESGETPSLENTATLLGLELSERLHKSDDDALLTMRVLRALCEKSECTPEKLLQKYSAARGISRDGCVWYEGGSFPDLLARLSRDPQSVGATRRMKCVSKYAALTCINPDAAPSPLKGRSLCAGKFFERDRTVETLNLIRLLADLGCKYANGIGNADFYMDTDALTGSDKGDKRDPRLGSARRNFRENGKPQIISPQKLFDILGTSERTLAEMSVPHMTIDEWIAGEKRLRSEKHDEPGAIRQRVPQTRLAHNGGSASTSIGELLRGCGVVSDDYPNGEDK